MSRRDEVLQAALELLDEVGLDALTMRRLAVRLDVQPGALYRHFDSKSALLRAMVDDLIGGGGGEGVWRAVEPWDESLFEMANTLRSAMLTRRDGARLVVSNLLPGPAEQAWDRYVAGLRAAGLSARGAVIALDTTAAFVNGFTIEEQARDGFPQPPARRAERDQAFAGGLRLIIDGIRLQLTPGSDEPAPG